MRRLRQASVIFMVLALSFTMALADASEDKNYQDTINVFKAAGESSSFFKTCYGYALFPTIGKGGMGIGGAHGQGRVYVGGNVVGATKMTQLTIGLQFGGQAYSQIIFFQDKRTFDDFTTGNFEFGAQATAVAITAGASAVTTTTGTAAGASVGKNNATSVGIYNRGMAVFTVAKGGLMYEASIGGQKFSYKAR